MVILETNSLDVTELGNMFNTQYHTLKIRQISRLTEVI